MTSHRYFRIQERCKSRIARPHQAYVGTEWELKHDSKNTRKRIIVEILKAGKSAGALDSLSGGVS
jgi:hypothetical protein